MKKIIIRLMIVIILFSLIGYNDIPGKLKKVYNNRTKYAGINVNDIKEEIIDANGPDIESNKRATVTYNPDKVTDESLSNFYKDKIDGDGYRYYTLINEKDKTQGIVSMGCINVLAYAEINDMGDIVRVHKNFEVKMDDDETID